MNQTNYPMDGLKPLVVAPIQAELSPAWHGRSIAGPKLRLVEFSAFVEQPQDNDMVW